MKEKIKLLIVYNEKDEEYFNHISELLSKNDDTDEHVIGVEDNSIEPLKCVEHKWLQWKKMGENNQLSEKVLFVDDIEGITLETPIYDEFGISFGPINDNQFMIKVDEEFEWNPWLYSKFHQELVDLVDLNITKNEIYKTLNTHKEIVKNNMKTALISSLWFALPGAILAACTIDDVKKVKECEKLLRDQMMCYAMTKAYYNGLQRFIEK